MRSTSRRLLKEYAWYFLIWTVIGIFFFSQGIVQKILQGEPTPWSHYLITWMMGVWIWALSMPVLRWLGRRFAFSRQTWFRTALVHLCLSVAVSILEIAANALILPYLHVFPTIMKTQAAAFIFMMVIGFHQNVLTYWTIIGVEHAIAYYWKYQERQQQALRLELRSAELQSQLVQAHLSALKMQLQPHFLFNTLNAIMVLVRQQKGREAEEMLARLSDLLRCVLDDVNAQEIPLTRELEFVKLYLSIEQVRFQDRLRVEIDARGEVLDAAVPHMGLQPIVENAIRHGIGKSSSAGTIHIAAAHEGNSLVITIADDGPGLPASPDPNSRGIGLANTRARLQQLYGNAATLTIANGPVRGAVATITLPYRVIGESADLQTLETNAYHSVVG